MPIEINIPSLGESITEVQISEWLKAEGDAVKKDESLAIIDSEKSTIELPAPESGRLVKILHPAGDTVKVGDAVAQIETDTNGHAIREPSQGGASAPKKEKEKETSLVPKNEASAAVPKGKSAGARRQERAAQAKREDAPTPQAASAPKLEEAEAPQKSPDIQPAPETTSKETSAPAPVENPAPPVPESAGKNSAADRVEEVVPMTMLRRTVAKRLVEAKQQMAMLTTFNEADLGAVQSLRQSYQATFEKKYQIKLGFMAFFVKASVDALKQYPQLNAEIRENDIVYHNYLDIGVAIATERGLVVPILRNADRLSFADVERAIADFARRAKEGKVKPDELEGGTFTITNGGVFGSLLSTPIINPPQTGILGMHTIQDRPVAVAGQVVIRPMMYLALTYDHRLVDGREAVSFLRRIKETIEAPARLLLEI